MKMGQVFGSTDRIGAEPTDRRLDPHDVLATIYRHLGTDHRQEINDPFGRPIMLSRGKPIQDLW
jgi:hypothetical protein